MNRAEIATLLGLAAARDRRTVGEADVAAWLTDVGDLDFAEAREALTRHFRESTDWLMPAHIRRHVRVIRDERRAHHEALALPSRFETDPIRAVRAKRGLAQARDVLQPVLERLAAMRPESSRSETLRRLAVDRATRERGLRAVEAPRRRSDAKGGRRETVQTRCCRPPSVAVTCAHCRAFFVDDDEGRQVHRVVFGHAPTVDSAPKCRIHRGQPADNCALCASERKART